MRTTLFEDMPLAQEPSQGRRKTLEMEGWSSNYLNEAQLAGRSCKYESWEIAGSSAKLSYLTHGFFRYFGKFPPPVAKRFIEELHDPSTGPVVDPMVGSGTTLVEAILLKRQAVGLDVNPLACLIAKVKTTPIPSSKITDALQRYTRFYHRKYGNRASEYIPQDAYLNHWFFEETQRGLAKTRQFIEEQVDDKDVKDFLLLTLASIIRHVSRASNGLGRMFLDPAIQPLDTHDIFIKKATQLLERFKELQVLNPKVRVIQHDARIGFMGSEKTNLVICHPPYFNLYRYSSIYKFEMLWLGYDYSDTRKQEVREGFKIGKAELVEAYLDDVHLILKNISHVLTPRGWCVLMIGDTFLRGERINTTARLIDRVGQQIPCLKLNHIIVRHPKYTEASYAATQRRAGKDVGVKLSDHLIVFQKNAP